MKKTRFLIGFLIVIASLLAIAGCGSAQAGPQDTLATALSNLSASTSHHSAFDVKIAMNGDKSTLDPSISQVLPLNLEIKGQVDKDVSDKSSPKFKIYGLSIQGLEDMMSKSAGSSPGSSLEGSISAGMVSSVISGMEMSFIKDTFYIKIGSAWYKMSLQDIPDSSGVDVKCLMDSLLSQPSGTFTSADTLSDVQEVGREDIDGVSTRHFQAGIDATKIGDQSIDAYSNMKKCSTSRTSTTTGTGTSTGPDTDKMRKFSDNLYKTTKLDFWVDGDNNVRQMKMSMDMNFGDLAQATGETTTPVGDLTRRGMDTVTMKLDATMDYSAFGQAVDITAPDKALPLTQLLNEIENSRRSQT